MRVTRWAIGGDSTDRFRTDERLQARTRGRRRRRDGDRRARSGGRRAPLPRLRHRGARRPLPLREHLGAAGRQRHRLEDAGPRAVRPAGTDRQRSRRPPVRGRPPRGRVEAPEARRHRRPAGPRRPRAAVGSDDGDRGALRGGRRGPRACVRRRRRAGQDGGGEVPAALARRGEPGPRQGDRHVLDLHRRARAQRLHVHGAGRRLDRSRLRRRDVSGRRRAERPAPRRRARTRAADARRGCEDGRPRRVRQEHPRAARPDHGLRPSRVSRRGSEIADPQARGAGGRDRRGSRSRRRSRRQRSRRCTSASRTT